MGKMSFRGWLCVLTCAFLLAACNGSSTSDNTSRRRVTESRPNAIHQFIEARLRSLVDDLAGLFQRVVRRGENLAPKFETFVTAYSGNSPAAIRLAHDMLAAELDAGLADIARIESAVSDAGIRTRFSPYSTSFTTEQARRIGNVRTIGRDFARNWRPFFEGLKAFLRDRRDERIAQLNAAPGSAPAARPTLPTLPSTVPPSITVTPAPTTSAPATGTITGIVLAPNSTDAVANALVYAPARGNEAAGGTVQTPRATPDLDCGEPAEPYIVKTCSRADGTFMLTGVPVGTIQLVVMRGLFTIRSAIAVLANQTAQLPRPDSTLPAVASARGSLPKIAVVLGTWDHLENVLAKLGLGETDARGHLRPGTERFTIYGNGTNSADDLFRRPSELAKHDMILINCTDNYNRLLGEELVLRNLRKFVEDGGRLYITDRAYNFVDRAFPRYIEFAGGEGANLGRANRGTGGISVNATIRSSALEGWLRNGVRCATPTSPATNTSPCLNADGTLPVSGFAGSWAMMDRIDPRHADDVATWIEGKTETAADAPVRPLTVTLNYGRGKVLFSSYHTHHDSTGAGVYAQERVLQYFVFELAR